MRPLALSLYIGLMCASTALAGAPDASLLAPINRFISDAYSGKAAEAATAFSNTPDSEIIDAFPPYLWRGPRAFAHWYADLEAVSRTEGLADATVVLAKPIRSESRGKRGYVVVPAVFRCKVRGRVFEEPGLMTYVLGKRTDGWAIHSWTWTGPVQEHTMAR